MKHTATYKQGLSSSSQSYLYKAVFGYGGRSIKSVIFSCLLMLGATVSLGCGNEGQAKIRPWNSPNGSDTVVGGDATVREMTAADYTPGFFRDLYRLLDAQILLADDVAVVRLQLELSARVEAMGELPDMLPATRSTLDALLLLALRTTQALQHDVAATRAACREILHIALSLDPAAAAFQLRYPNGTPTPTESGAKTIALAAESAMAHASRQLSGLCAPQLFSSSGSSWDPGDAEVVWINEICEPDRRIGGYCEQDRMIPGQCYDNWIPEQCHGGYWEDRGYYEYYCYSQDDCRNIWRERRVYVEGQCYGGYYEEYCESDRYETGICYDGTYVPGYCIPGHLEYRFPGGVWSFEGHLTAPAECSQVRPAQFSIAVTLLHLLKEKAYDDLENEWQAAVDSLLRDGDLNTPNEGTLDAIQQIIIAVTRT